MQRLAYGILACAFAVLMLGAAAAPAGAVSSAVTVTATVASATNLTTTGCATGSAATSFGLVAPGSNSVTTADCNLVFGSSNDTAMLRAFQVDGFGDAMYRPPIGGLDTTNFGSGTGKVVTSLVAGVADNINAIAVQPDGKIVVVGSSGGADSQVMVARFNANGSLDSAGFGTSGVFTLNPTTGTDYANAVALQTDGSIVVAASQDEYAAGAKLLVLRLTPAGVLDASFGTGGKVNPAGLAGSEIDAGGVFVRPDGRIVVAGNSGASGAPGIQATFVGLTSTGGVDTAFGAGGSGKLVIDLGNNNDDYIYGARLLADGSIVAVGTSFTTAFRQVICKVKPDGTGLDPTFNGTGVKTYTVVGTGGEYALDVSEQPDGNLVIVGSAPNAGTNDGTIVRMSATGVMDASFGSSGIVRIAAAGGEQLRGIYVQPDGAIMADGQIGATTDTVIERRLGTNGSADTSFNATGRLTVAQSAGNDRANDLAVTSEGRMIIAGEATGATLDSALLQLGTVTIPNYGGTNLWSSSMFGACLHGISGGATVDASTWTQNASCPATDGAYWKPLATAGNGASGKVANTTTGVTTATASLRFGLRTLAAQPSGSYVAPFTVEVIAPNV